MLMNAPQPMPLLQVTSQGKDGHIVVFGWLARELLDSIENGRADFCRGLRLGALKIVLDLIQSKFFRPTLRLDDSPGHKHQGVPGPESDNGCFGDDMGTQRQGRACSREFEDSRSVPQHTRSVTGIEVRDRTQAFVVATGKGGTEKNASRRFQDGAV